MDAVAGGSGLNVVVVVNQHSTNSVELGNYYAQKRQVPPDNFLRIEWAGSRVAWSRSDFTAVLRDPLVAMLAQRQLTNQVDYVVLSMDIPYRVTDTNGANSTTSALFYGFKSDGKGLPGLPSCSLPDASTNTYCGSEGIFRATGTGALPDTYLVTMLTSSNLAEAKAIVDQGVAGDGTFPPQPAYLGKSNDRLRNIRYAGFDNAIFNSRLLNRSSLLRTNVNGPENLGYISGYANGSAVFNTGQTRFAPGSMADDLTSFSGRLYEPNDQTTLLAFLQAGASGSYGTVVEPCAHLEKFASPQNYFYQARGFALAECYYQSVGHPHQGLLVAEPLSAPYARAGSGQWAGLPENAVLSGTTNLQVSFLAADPGRPLQQVDLFINGRFARTLTNVVPQPGNRLRVTVGGQPHTTVVGPGATLESLARELASNLSAPGSIRATAHGDRVELQGLELGTSGGQIGLSASSDDPQGDGLTAFVTASGASCLDTEAFGYRSYVLTNPPAIGDFLELTVTKTNGQVVVVAVTNTAPGTNIGGLTRALIDLANSHPDLKQPDGVVIEDVNMHEDYPFNEYIYGTNDHSGEFNIRAVTAGWPASQIQVRLAASPNLRITPSTPELLDENLEDLRPRAHLYVTAGVTNLRVAFNVDTTTLPDGWHELTAVACEGSHVRTQTRVSQRVLVRNTSLAATLSLVSGVTNVPIGTPLVFSVQANLSDIASIELHGTGGVLSNSVLHPASFAVDSAMLGRGIHRFNALVTARDGKQFRTEPIWVSVGQPLPPEPPFRLSFTVNPPLLSWPATPGRTYEVLRSTNTTEGFTPQSSLTATSANLIWVDPAPVPAGGLYRVRAIE